MVIFVFERKLQKNETEELGLRESRSPVAREQGMPKAEDAKLDSWESQSLL
jgi:hypothetical protein